MAVRFDHNPDFEGNGPAVEYEFVGKTDLTEEEARTIALLEIAWALRGIEKGYRNEQSLKGI